MMERENIFHINADTALKLLTIVFIALISFIILDLGVLPSFFTDETRHNVYSRLLPLSETPYPMYLYYAVYSLTKFAGDQFFILVKIFNCIFYCATIPCIYFIVRRIVNERWAYFTIVLVMLDPGHIYTALTIIEPMYFFFFWLLAMFVLCVDDRNIRYFVISGMLLGLLSLVKPHGLFLIPIFMFFMLADNYKRITLGKSLIGIAVFVLMVFSVKFAFGFLVAGKSGLTLFGTFYNSNVEEGGNLARIVKGFLINFPAHLLALFFLFTPALLAYSIWICTAIKKRCEKLECIERYSLFALPALLCIIAETVIATVIISNTQYGNTETIARIHMRHYYFLFPFCYIALAYMAQNSIPQRKYLLNYIIPTFGILIICSAWVALAGFDLHFIDCPQIYAAWINPAISILYALIGIVLCILMPVSKTSSLKKSFAFLIILNSVLISISADAELSNFKNLEKYSAAGIATKHFLSQEGRDNTLCLTSVNYPFFPVLATIYHLDSSKNIDRVFQVGDIPLQKKYIDPSWQYVIDFYDCFDTDNFPVLRGNGFKIVRLSPYMRYGTGDTISFAPLGKDVILNGMDIVDKEGFGHWTSSDIAGIFFRCRDNIALKLKFPRLRVISNASNSSEIKVDVSVNGKFLSQWIFDKNTASKEFYVDIPKELLDHKEIHMQFKINDGLPPRLSSITPAHTWLRFEKIVIEKL